MENIYIILLLISFIIIIYSLNIINNNQQHITSINNNYTNKTKAKINNIVSSEKCFLDKCNLCPMRSFKQCTNNYSLKMYPPLSKYPCNNTNNSIPDLNRMSEKNLINKLNKSNEKILIGPKNNPRVNIWNIL